MAKQSEDELGHASGRWDTKNCYIGGLIVCMMNTSFVASWVAQSVPTEIEQHEYWQYDE